MGDKGHNEYFNDYQLFGSNSNPQFAMIYSQQEESSLFKDLRQPYLQQHFHDLHEVSFQKFDKQLTQADTKPKANLRNQPKEETQNISQQIAFENIALLAHKAVFKGTKDDTVELNINFKTILANYLKELKIANQLNEFQLQQLQQFVKRVPSFKSLKELFSQEVENQRLRNVCLEFVESGKCMRRILASRCGLYNKLQMVKYVQKLGLNIKHKEIVKWKYEVTCQKIFQ